MTRRQISLLVFAVVLLHIGAFWLLGGAISTLPPRRFPAPPQDTLRLRETNFVHPDTGETMVYREIRVSTKLALPDALMNESGNSTK